MPSDSALIATIAVGIGAAFLLGALATKLRIPAVVGYLLAGIALGPFTPGIVANTSLATQLADLGVILLMFGVGLQLSFRDLMAVRQVVLPGAPMQVTLTGGAAALAALALGQEYGGAVVAGLSVITASTVIMLRGLEARDRLDSPEGRIAIGWSVAEDILTVFALVILPVVAPVITKAPGGIIGDRFWPALLVSLAKIVAFVTLMVFVGRRFVPWLLEQVARLGSRELFTLAVLDRAGISRAKLLVVTAPEPIRARRIVEVAREAQPALDVAVRTHSAGEQEFFDATLEAGGARGRAVYAEREAALGLAHYTLQSIGRSDDQADVVVDAIREEPPPRQEALLTGEVPDQGTPRRRSTD